VNREQLEYFRQKLETMSQDLLQEAEKTIHEMTDSTEN
jgi:RNA polymerase-binding transcription factor DksA